MRDFLAHQATENFVGRREDIAFLLKALEGDRPVVVHVYGIGGIGKSNLMEVFAALAKDPGVAVICMDCRGIEPTEQGFLRQLAQLLGSDSLTLEEVSERLECLGKRVVIALDTYEVLRLMDTWLRQVFIPALTGNVRVFLFGREPPISAWLISPGWQELFQSIRLESLKEEEAIELLQKLGVKKEDARSINRFAHGHPLALKLAAATMKERHSFTMEKVVTQHAVEEFLRFFLSDVGDPLTREALDAASVVRRVTSPLLTALLPNADPQDAYKRLQALPFVESGSDGLILHDAVREALASALHATDPYRYRLFRHAAWSQLRTELSVAGRSELWRYTADMLYMIENPIVREAFFPSDVQPFAVEPAELDDLNPIQTITELQDGPHAAALIKYWFKNKPDAFYVVRDQKREAVGYYCMFDPAVVKKALLKDDPVVWSWWQHLQDDPIPKNQRALFLRRWLDRERGDVPSPVQAACWLDIKRAYIEHRFHLRRVYATVQDPQPYASVLPKLGFQLLGQIQEEIDAKQYYSAVLDFGPSLVSGWLTKLIDAELGIEPDEILDVEARELATEGSRVRLTKLEFDVMNYLCQREGKVVTRISLLENVWGYEYEGGSNVVDVVIRSLRRKLGEKASLIETVTGMGYRFHRPTPAVKYQ